MKKIVTICALLTLVAGFSCRNKKRCHDSETIRQTIVYKERVEKYPQHISGPIQADINFDEIDLK
jgi:hypothetical protein